MLPSLINIHFFPSADQNTFPFYPQFNHQVTGINFSTSDLVLLENMVRVILLLRRR